MTNNKIFVSPIKVHLFWMKLVMKQTYLWNFQFLVSSKIGNFIWDKIVEYCCWVKKKDATGSNKRKFFSLCWHAYVFYEIFYHGHWNTHFQTRRDELRVLIQCLRQFILCFLAYLLYKELHVSYCFLNTISVIDWILRNISWILIKSQSLTNTFNWASISVNIKTKICLLELDGRLDWG